MAFRSNGPIMLALPPFRGFTRRIILVALSVFFGLLVLGLLAPPTTQRLIALFVLDPQRLLPYLWQPITYPFVSLGLLSVASALLTIWFFGSTLEDERGSHWLREYFFASSIGGGILATLLVLAVGPHVPALDPSLHPMAAFGMWPAALAMLLAFARFHAEQEISFNFIFRLKAKYLAAIYLLLYLAFSLIGGDHFGPLTALCNALCGYVYLRFAPRQGLGFGVSEGWFGMRNAWYRARRRRAAKKFTVYMRKQGKDVNLDADGRYIDPLGRPRDPNDKRWMN